MEMRTNPDFSPDLTSFPYSFSFFSFLNACNSVKTSLINTKLGDFENLGVLFQSVGISSCWSHNLKTPT